MNSFLGIFFKTNKTFDYLDNKYDDDVESNSSLIFMIVGAISGYGSFIKEQEYIKDFSGDRLIYFYAIFSILLGAGIGVIIGRYILTYIFYWVGQLLKGNADKFESRAVVAYSMIPNILKLPVFLYFGFFEKSESITGFKLWVINGFETLIWILTIKIMIQGLARFNKYGYLKAIINCSPFLMIGLIIYVFTFFKLT